MMVFFLFLGIAFVLGHYAVNQVYDSMMNTSFINNSVQAKGVMQDSKNATERMDYLSIAVYIGFLLALIVTGWFLAVNPMFFILYAIASIVLVIVSGIFSYVWVKFQDASVLFSSEVTLHFPLTNFILTNLPIFVLVAVIISLVITYAKSGMTGGQ